MFKALIERALSHFVTANRYQTLSQVQVEAYTDLLAVAMVIDHHIAQEERDLITTLLERFEWPSSRPSEHFINQSVRRAWGLLEAKQANAAVLTYCKDIAMRLEDDWLRENAFVALMSIIKADDKLEPSEVNLIEHVSEAFGFTTEHTNALIERAEKLDPNAPPEAP